MQMLLKAAKNPDYPRGHSEGWDLPKAQTVTVASVDEAIAKLEAWRDEHHLGGGNMGKGCGDLTENGVKVGNIAYNGRFFAQGA